MKRTTLLCAGLAVASFASTPASAQVAFYGNTSPTGNYAAFLAALTGFGATPTTLTFSGHPTGPLNPNFYPGVTLTPVGDVSTVQNNAGPADGNTGSTPLSPGEGPHAPSEYIFDGGARSSLTISFANSVFGGGLFVIDYFNPTGGNNPLTLEAFTGQNGTGTSLGSFSSVSYNFQNNNMYFMGITSGAGNIGSLVYTDVNSSTGDTTGIDDITYGAGTVTPEPASMLLMATGLTLVAMVRRKRSATV